MKNNLKYVLPENVTTRVTYSGTRSSSKFTKIKDKTCKGASTSYCLLR